MWPTLKKGGETVDMMKERRALKRDAERRAEVKKELARPVKPHGETLASIRRRNALKAELKQLDARLTEHRDAIIRAARPDLIVRHEW